MSDRVTLNPMVAGEVRDLRPRDRVDEDVELRPHRRPRVRDHARDRGIVGDIRVPDERRIDAVRQPPGLLRPLRPPVHDPDPRPLCVERLRDPPRERVPVRDPEDERGPAVERAHGREDTRAVIER